MEAVGIDEVEFRDVVVREVERLEIEQTFETRQVGDLSARCIKLADLGELAGEERTRETCRGVGVPDAQRVGDDVAESGVGDVHNGICHRDGDVARLRCRRDLRRQFAGLLVDRLDVLPDDHIVAAVAEQAVESAVARHDIVAVATGNLVAIGVVVGIAGRGDGQLDGERDRRARRRTGRRRAGRTCRP